MLDTESLNPILVSLFKELNQSGVRYCLLRDYGTVDEINNCQDLDVSINSEDKRHVKKY